MKNNLDTPCAAIVKPAMFRQVKKKMDSVDPTLRPLPWSGCDFVDELVAPHYFQHKARGGELAAAQSLGMIEVRLALVGTEVLLGVPLSEIAGAGLKAKGATAASMSAEAFTTLAQKVGFVVKCAAGTGTILPSEHVVAIVNPLDERMDGTRWQVAGVVRTSSKL